MPRLLLKPLLRNANADTKKPKLTSPKSRLSLEMPRELSGSWTANSTRLVLTCPREREDTERSKRVIVVTIPFSIPYLSVYYYSNGLLSSPITNTLTIKTK